MPWPQDKLTDLLAELGLAACPPRWQELFAPAMQAAEINSYLVDESWLKDLIHEYNILAQVWPQISQAAAEIAQNKALLAYLLLLQAALADRQAFWQEKELIQLPRPDGQAESLGYDLLVFFLVPPTIAGSWAAWSDQAIPHKIRWASLQSYEQSLLLHRRREGKWGYSLGDLSWNLGFADGLTLRIGRLNMQKGQHFAGHIKVYADGSGRLVTLAHGLRLHQSGFALGSPGLTDETGSWLPLVEEDSSTIRGYPVLPDGRAGQTTISLARDQWQLVLEKGDPVINVHIPPDEPLSPALCAESYRQTIELYRTCFPDFKAKAFSCHSWLMDPQLALLLPESANIVRFMRQYTIFPAVSNGQAVFRFVFEKDQPDLRQLPESTSLERALKQHYLAGRYIYQPGGYFMIPDQAD